MSKQVKHPSKRKVPINRSVAPEIEREIQAIAETRGRTKSWATEQLLILGIIAFNTTGRLPVDDASAEFRQPEDSSAYEALRLAVKGWRETLSESELQLIRQVMRWEKVTIESNE